MNPRHATRVRGPGRRCTDGSLPRGFHECRTRIGGPKAPDLRSTQRSKSLHQPGEHLSDDGADAGPSGPVLRCRVLGRSADTEVAGNLEKSPEVAMPTHRVACRRLWVLCPAASENRFALFGSGGRFGAVGAFQQPPVGDLVAVACVVEDLHEGRFHRDDLSVQTFDLDAPALLESVPQRSSC